MKLAGQVAIVTGGGRGIGRAIALRFAAEGAAVAVAARSEAELREVAREIEAKRGKAVAIRADVSRQEDCQRIVAETHGALGGIHILVNNAGALGPVQALENVSPQQWDEVMATNLRGPFLLCRLVLPEMYSRGSGAILNVSSVAGKAALQLNSAYAASKAGLLGFTRTLAAEAARKGVRVNALCPGPVPETRMSQELGRGLGEYFQGNAEEMLESFIATHVLQGRPQTAEEVAAAALFLASDESSAITGQTLNVDGGMIFY